MGALIRVDNRQGATHGDGAIFTGFETSLAADTADFTVLVCLNAGPLITATDGIGIQMFGYNPD